MPFCFNDLLLNAPREIGNEHSRFGQLKTTAGACEEAIADLTLE
jgi:hypothetical protein